jgi:hypothetical protein
MSENYRARRSRTQGEWRRARQKRIRERKRRRQRQRRLRMGIAAALCVILCSTVIFLIQRGGEGSRASKTKQADTPGMSMTGSDTLLDAAAQARIEEVRVRCATNCTRDTANRLTIRRNMGVSDGSSWSVLRITVRVGKALRMLSPSPMPRAKMLP